jgi:trigger factor
MSPPPAAAETAPETANNVKVEDAGPARKRLSFTIPAAVIDEKLAESVATLSSEAAIPGFRKGHVPQKLIERRFGSSIRTETKNQLIANAYAEAIEQHKLKPVGEPEPVGDVTTVEIEQGKPLSFAVEVEVAPEFDLPALDGIEIKKPMLEIADDLIESELKRQQTMHGEASDVTDSPLQSDDRLIGLASVTRNDEAEPFFRQDNVVVTYPGEDDGGKGQVLGLLIPDLRKRLAGAKIGEAITIETTGPDAHEREDIRGAKLKIVLEPRQIQRITPADTTTVALRYGLPDEAMLREQIKLALEQRRDDEQASAMREQAIEALAGMIDFELPQKLSAQQAARNLENFRLELLSQGKTEEEVEQALAEVRSESDEQTRERLKRFFLLLRLGEHFKVEVSEQEVNGRIATIAAQRGLRPEKLRTELAQSGRLGEVARLVRDQKAADRLVQQVKKTEVNADEWNQMFTDKQQSDRAKSTTKRKTAKKS